MIGIYKITNPKGKVYIGQSVQIEKRKKKYSKLACKGQPRLYNSLLKYGFHTHTFSLIEECTVEQLNTRERYWQEFYNVLSEEGLNCKLTNTDNKVQEYSEKTRRLIGEKSGKARKGVPLAEAHKASIKKALNESEAFKNSHQSVERNDRISKALLGRSLSQEHKDSIRLAQNLRFETCISWMKGKKHTQDAIEKMKGPKTKEHIEKNKEAHVKYRDIECWTSEGVYVKTYRVITEAVKDGFIHGSIIKCLLGKSATHKKFIWKYKEKELQN
jgi:group I intron endonuclease